MIMNFLGYNYHVIQNLSSTFSLAINYNFGTMIHNDLKYLYLG